MSTPDRWQVVAARLDLADRDQPGALTALDRPSLDQVVDLFRRLGSGRGGDLAINGAPGERDLNVCGGPSSYLVFCIGEDYGAYNLVDPSGTDRAGSLTLTVGGMPSAVEAAATVGEALALRAIRYFHTHGGIDPQLRWE